VVWIVGFIGLVILFWGFPQYVYFPSQNAATHALMARAMRDSAYQQEWLAHSFFGGKFIDQQWGYSWLLSIFQEGLPSPWHAERMIQILFLLGALISLFFVLHRLSKSLGETSEVPSEWFILAALGVAVGLAPAGVWFRVYLLRIETMVWFFILSSLLLLYWFEERRVRRFLLTLFWLAGWLWFGSLFSYILWILLLALLIIPRRKLDRLIYFLVFLLVWGLSFWWRGDVLLQLRYALKLIAFTMSGTSGIREWEPLRLSWETLWPSVLSILCWLGAFWLWPKMRNRFWLAYFVIAMSFVVGSFFYQRFTTLAYLMNIPVSAYLILRFLGELTYPELLGRGLRPEIIQGLMAVLALSGVAIWYVKTPRLFQRWNDELYNYHETTQALSRYVPVGEKVVITSWEHWSILSWHIPQNSFEPGYSTLIYELVHPPAIQCLNFLKSGKWRTFSHGVNCMQEIKTFFGSRWLLIDKASANKRSSVLLLKKLLLPLRLVWESSESALFEIVEDVRLNDWLVSSLSYPHKFPHKFRWVDPHVLVHPQHGIVQSLSAAGSFEGEYDIGGSLFSWTRSLMSAWIFCQNGFFNKNTCQSLLKNYQNYRSQWEKGLGNQAFLGLLAMEVADTSLVEKQWESVINFLLPSGLWREVRYGDRSAIFYPGEALTFLYRKLFEDCVKAKGAKRLVPEKIRLADPCSVSLTKLPLIEKLEKAYAWYLFSWMLSRDPFYLRWLNEIIFWREKLGRDTQFEKKELAESYLFWGSVFCYAKSKGLAPTWSPLLNEGFSYFVQNICHPLGSMMRSCALAATRQSHPKFQGYFFPLRSHEPTLRDDLQAHGLNGFRVQE